VGVSVGLPARDVNAMWHTKLPGVLLSPITNRLMPSSAVWRTSSSRHWSSCAFRVAPDHVRPRTRTLVESRRLLHVVTDPNTPGADEDPGANDAGKNDIEKDTCVVSEYVPVISATLESAQPRDRPLSYTMYASVSASGIT
jgi:hypothetical protein